MKKAILLYFVVVLCACNNSTKSTSDYFTQIESLDTSFVFNEFEIIAKGEEDFEKFKTYREVYLFKNKTQILKIKDSLEFEFGFGFRTFPNVLHIQNTSNIVLEVNNRPSKNYLLVYSMKDGEVYNTMKIPTLIYKPIDLDGDGFTEIAGFWDYSEFSGTDEASTTSYNPIIYYEINNDGLKIDSTLTIDRNIEIYGEFHGFNYSSQIQLPISVSEKMDNEINSIGKKE